MINTNYNIAVNKNNLHNSDIPIQTIPKAPSYQDGITTFESSKSGSHKKISTQEAFSLIGLGALKQGKEIITSIINNPIKTIAIAGATTIGLMALPFIGIPTAIGGGALAIGFAGLSLFKGIKNFSEFYKNNKDGSYHIARQHLVKVGESTLDIALSAPFVPKAITNIKNFVKHGSIAINSQLLNELKNTKSPLAKLKTIVNADKNLSQSISYKGAVESELSKIEGITDAQKATIKEELLKFDVPQEKIPEIVLDKWAQIKGISTKPDIKYQTLAKTVGGHATPKDCSITINDHKRTIRDTSYDQYELVKTDTVGETYVNTYRDKTTGAIMQDTIEKSMLERYENLYKIEKGLTPQGKQILTTLHEREHIHQYAQILEQKHQGVFTPTPRAQQLYNQMAQEMTPIQPGSAQALQVEQFALARNNGTPVSYIKNAREVAAREAEYAAINNADFQRLNRVFEQANKTTPPKIGNTILINTIRPESAIS